MNRQKGISTTLAILLIVLLAVIVGGVVTYKYYLVSEGGPSAGEVPGESQDETADWKTYKNEKYGFEVKYPSDFLISNKEKELERIIGIMEPQGEKQERIIPYKQIIRIDPQESFYESYESDEIESGFIDVAICDGDLGECFKAIPKEMEVRSPVRIDKINEITFYDFYLVEQGKSSLLKITYRTTHKNLLYEVNLNISRPESARAGTYRLTNKWQDIKYRFEKYKHDADKLLKKFNEILSSFNFTEEENLTEDISNWKTYKNENYGFEFKYPSDSQIWAKGETDEPDFGFRSDYLPVFFSSKLDTIVKLKFPKYAFLPREFKYVDISSNTSGTMYIGISTGETAVEECGYPGDFGKKEMLEKEKVNIGGKNFYYLGYYGDSDMMGYNKQECYSFPWENSCYRIAYNTYSGSGVYKAGPPFGLSRVIYDSERFKNLFKQIISTFRFLE